jgi:hypothetical protein
VPGFADMLYKHGFIFLLAMLFVSDLGSDFAALEGSSPTRVVLWL